MKDLTNQYFGKWEVIKEVEGSVNNKRQWLCECNCGLQKVVLQHNLTTGKSKSCYKCRNRYTTHKMGNDKNKFYQIWKNMKGRCSNPNKSDYKYYGRKGITVCERWLKFENFYIDMFSSFKENLTLDRIDGNKGYFPENCRWTTRKEQSNNLSSNLKLEWQGKLITEAELSRLTGVKRTTIQSRRRKGATVEQMVYGIPKKKV